MSAGGEAHGTPQSGSENQVGSDKQRPSPHTVPWPEQPSSLAVPSQGPPGDIKPNELETSAELGQFFPQSAPTLRCRFLMRTPPSKPPAVRRNRSTAITDRSLWSATQRPPCPGLFNILAQACLNRSRQPLRIVTVYPWQALPTATEHLPPPFVTASWPSQPLPASYADYLSRRQSKNRRRYGGTHKHGMAVSQPASGWTSPLLERSVSPEQVHAHGPPHYSAGYHPDSQCQFGPPHLTRTSPTFSPTVSDYFKYPAASYHPDQPPPEHRMPFDASPDSQFQRTSSLQMHQHRARKRRSADKSRKPPKQALSRGGMNASWANLASLDQQMGKSEGKPEDMPVVVHPIQVRQEREEIKKLDRKNLAPSSETKEGSEMLDCAMLWTCFLMRHCECFHLTVL